MYILVELIAKMCIAKIANILYSYIVGNLHQVLQLLMTIVSSQIRQKILWSLVLIVKKVYIYAEYIFFIIYALSSWLRLK